MYVCMYRVYSQISIAWNKQIGAAFSNSPPAKLGGEFGSRAEG